MELAKIGKSNPENPRVLGSIPRLATRKSKACKVSRLQAFLFETSILHVLAIRRAIAPHAAQEGEDVLPGHGVHVGAGVKFLNRDQRRSL